MALKHVYDPRVANVLLERNVWEEIAIMGHNFIEAKMIQTKNLLFYVGFLHEKRYHFYWEK